MTDPLRPDHRATDFPFVNGKSDESCLGYLMPGCGSIQKVQRNDGPSAANQVTPCFDNPIVWAGS